MRSYKFGSLDGVSMHYIVKVCSDMLSNEMDEVRHFKYNDYRWYVGVNVHDRLRDILGLKRITCTPIGEILGIDVATSYAVAPNEIMLRVRPDYSAIDELKRIINSVYETESFITMPRKLGRTALSGSLKLWNISIRNVIFNDPATIVFWSDGTKTVVKAANEPFDPEKGLAMAICKKYFGNEGNYYDIFRKWLPEKED